jgi:tetratricopeptide (TPR) repeat protein
VVVDTGSRDRTPVIARLGGARVHEFPWTEDFSAARNHALGLATGRWILYIDADERLRPCDRAELRTRLADPSHVGFWVQLYPQPGFTAYPEMRLFRNDPRIRFRGVIHEDIWPGIQAYRAACGGRVGRSGLVLDHVGYDGDQRPKHLRNLPLLQKAVREDPSRVFHWCHLASAHLALGETESAEEAWKTALEVVRKKRPVQVADSLPYIGLVQWWGGRGLEVEQLVTEGVARFPKNLQLRWLQGVTLMRGARFTDAVPVFEGLLAAAESGDFDHMSYDARLLDLLPHEALATCHFKLGDYAASRRHFERAARLAPDTLEYRVKRDLCALLEREGSRRTEPTTP